MCRKLILCGVVGLLALLSVGYAGAQTDVAAPDAGVKGSGVIALSNIGAAAIFDISVVKYGDACTGGFRFSEVDSTGLRKNVVVTKEIKGLVVDGNTARVRAVGYWNNILCEIFIEALDDTPSGDWMSVTVSPVYLDSSSDMPSRRWEGGVRSGDIVVFSKPQVHAYAKGYGSIMARRNIGRFEFYGQTIWPNMTTDALQKVEGKIYYAEYNPLIMSIMPRPVVQIVVSQISSLVLKAPNVAILRGMGTFNGRKAIIEVVAADNTPPYPTFAPTPPDHFTITATMPDVNRKYQASGDVMNGGEITVGSYSR